MARKKRKPAFSRKDKLKIPRDDREERRNQPYTPSIPKSERFESYYKMQGVIPETEWDLFISTLRKPLPVTFRVTGGAFDFFAKEIKKKLETLFSKGGQTVTVDGISHQVDPPRPIAWYPDNSAWYINTSRRLLRRVPELEEFHKFLIAQTEMGNISRQEEVSMIPPFFLQIQPHHKVLDMCAAPGSKTAQMIEMLHSHDKEKPPTGVVVANDVDQNRCYMLTHQIKRLQSPCIIVTNHEAQAFPFIKAKSKDDTIEKSKEGMSFFQFDRILCDAPCSGDGTLRKNIELWTKWHTGMGHGLHKLQLKIATKGVHLLKVGGRMVYSTCSLNPVEDEAVVAELLRRFKGTLRLLDMSKEFPNLVRRPGLSTWKIQDKDGTPYATFEDVCARKGKSRFVVKSLFPPTEEEAKSFHLERCMRFFPHLADTGGFFVSVLEKVSTTMQLQEEIENQEEKEEKEEKESGEAPEEKLEVPEVVDDTPIPKITQRKGNEEPYLPFPPELNSVWENITNFFGLPENFPKSQLMIRSEKSVKIYFISPGNKEFFRMDEKGVTRVVNSGVKIFSKHDSPTATGCPYRITSEGIRWLLPYMSKRKITVTEDDLKILLTTQDPFFDSFNINTRKALADVEQGSIAILLSEESSIFPGLALPGWRGKVSCRLQLPKADSVALKKLILDEKIESKFKNKEQKSSGKEEETPMEVDSTKDK